MIVILTKDANIHRAMSAEAAERARLVEEFKQRKREAAENRARGSNDYRPTPVSIKNAVFKIVFFGNPTTLLSFYSEYTLLSFTARHFRSSGFRRTVS